MLSRFYLGKHSGRQLSLQPQHGSADLNAMFYGVKKTLASSSGATASGSSNSMEVGEEEANGGGVHGKGGSRKHIIQVSTYQMVCIKSFMRQRHSFG